MPFVWTPSNTLALAYQKCACCLGLGLKRGRGGQQTACLCVKRAIFREVLQRFRECSVDPDPIARFQGMRSLFDLRREEFRADVVSIAKKCLASNPQHPKRHKLFTYFFLHEAGWKLCSKKLNISRGHCFHEIYRIQEVCGQAFAEHHVWPLDEYFGGVVNTKSSGHVPFSELP